MYTLIKENVERVVHSESDRDRLMMKGYIPIRSGYTEETILDPQDYSIALEDMTVEELRAYAEENGIDLGKSTSQTGILEKIKASLG